MNWQSQFKYHCKFTNESNSLESCSARSVMEESRRTKARGGVDKTHVLNRKMHLLRFGLCGGSGGSGEVEFGDVRREFDATLEFFELLTLVLLERRDFRPDVIAHTRERNVLPRLAHRRQLANHVRVAWQDEPECAHERAIRDHRADDDVGRCGCWCGIENQAKMRVVFGNGAFP